MVVVDVMVIEDLLVGLGVFWVVGVGCVVICGVYFEDVDFCGVVYVCCDLDYVMVMFDGIGVLIDLLVLWYLYVVGCWMVLDEDGLCC